MVLEISDSGHDELAGSYCGLALYPGIGAGAGRDSEGEGSDMG